MTDRDPTTPAAATNGAALKPCPFCGGVATIEHPVASMWSAGCEAEGCKLNPFAGGASRAEAIKDWNRRAALDLPSAPSHRTAGTQLEPMHHSQFATDATTPGAEALSGPARDMVIAAAHAVCSAAAYPNTSVERRWLRDRWLVALDALGITEDRARAECHAAMRGIYAALARATAPTPSDAGRDQGEGA